MKRIQRHLAAASLTDGMERLQRLSRVEDELLAMQRLWAQGSGLIARRQAEANLWREGYDTRDDVNPCQFIGYQPMGISGIVRSIPRTMFFCRSKKGSSTTLQLYCLPSARRI